MKPYFPQDLSALRHFAELGEIDAGIALCLCHWLGWLTQTEIDPPRWRVSPAGEVALRRVA